MTKTTQEKKYSSKDIVFEGLNDLYTEFESGLSTSEVEAFENGPENAVVAFQKFIGKQDANSLRARLIAIANEKKA